MAKATSEEEKGCTEEHHIVRCYKKYAQSNARRHRRSSLQKIGEILNCDKTPSEEVSQRSEKIYLSKRNHLETSMHVSVNIKNDRLRTLLEVGELRPSIPRTEIDKRYRYNAEQCFSPGSTESPIYGALNLYSTCGGAPSYSDDFKVWVKLSSAEIKSRTTFTARDSHYLTLACFPDFDLNQSTKALLREIFTWDTIPDFILNRFWGCQELSTTDYVEAQVWGQVYICDIESFHVKEDIFDSLLADLDELNETENLNYFKARLVKF